MVEPFVFVSLKLFILTEESFIDIMDTVKYDEP